jgi:hypothetical protein
MTEFLSNAADLRGIAGKILIHNCPHNSDSSLRDWLARILSQVNDSLGVCIYWPQSRTGIFRRGHWSRRLLLWISLLDFRCGYGRTHRSPAPPDNCFICGALLAVKMLLVKLCRFRPRTGRFELLHPRHVEVAGLLCRLSTSVRYRPVPSIVPAPRRPIEVGTTSLELHLSVDRTQHRGRPIHIYSLSGERALSPRASVFWLAWSHACSMTPPASKCSIADMESYTFCFDA